MTNDNFKIYINKSNNRYFVCLFNSAAVIDGLPVSKVLEVHTSKKRSLEAAIYYAGFYNCEFVK